MISNEFGHEMNTLYMKISTDFSSSEFKNPGGEGNKNTKGEDVGKITRGGDTDRDLSMLFSEVRMEYKSNYDVSDYYEEGVPFQNCTPAPLSMIQPDVCLIFCFSVKQVHSKDKNGVSLPLALGHLFSQKHNKENG